MNKKTKNINFLIKKQINERFTNKTFRVVEKIKSTVKISIN